MVPGAAHRPDGGHLHLRQRLRCLGFAASSPVGVNARRRSGGYLGRMSDSSYNCSRTSVRAPPSYGCRRFVGGAKYTVWAVLVHVVMIFLLDPQRPRPQRLRGSSDFLVEKVTSASSYKLCLSESARSEETATPTRGPRTTDRLDEARGTTRGTMREWRCGPTALARERSSE